MDELDSLLKDVVCVRFSNGRLPCSPVASAVLGSFTAQSELGDYDVGEHGTGIEYLQDIPFSPHQTDELLEKIAELHRSDRYVSQNISNRKKLMCFQIKGRLINIQVECGK